MKLLKKNQVIIYVFILMLMTAGYLNFAANSEIQEQSDMAVQTSMQIESRDDTQIADIGDATLVSSNDVVVEDEGNSSENLDEENINKNIIEDENETVVEEKEQEQDKEETIETNTTVTNEYFIKSKLDRDQMYSQMIETYENVLNSSNSSETQKQSATEEIKKINDTKNKIMICENLISIKGFTNNVIFVNDNSINVIVGAEKLEAEEIAQIQNIISREMQTEIENIHITMKN